MRIIHDIYMYIHKRLKKTSNKKKARQKVAAAQGKSAARVPLINLFGLFQKNTIKENKRMSGYQKFPYNIYYATNTSLKFKKKYKTRTQGFGSQFIVIY